MMGPEELKQIEIMLAPVFELVGKGGWSLAAIPVLLVALVNMYRLPAVQGALEARAPKTAWVNLPQVAKWAIPFGVALLGSLITGLSGSTSWPAAILGGVVAGFSAVLTHHGGKAVAGTRAAVRTAAAIPSAISRPLSLVVPVDWHRVMAERGIVK